MPSAREKVSGWNNKQILHDLEQNVTMLWQSRIESGYLQIPKADARYTK